MRIVKITQSVKTIEDKFQHFLLMPDSFHAISSSLPFLVSSTTDCDTQYSGGETARAHCEKVGLVEIACGTGIGFHCAQIN